MNRRQGLSLIGMLAIVAPALAAPPATQPATTQPASRPAGHNFARWEKDIAAYEAQDRERPPAKGGVVFTGSSTVRGWRTLARDFPDHNVINRGFGGSQIIDATYYADRIILPYEPKAVFLRSGPNDIHVGKSPERVFNDFKAFVEKIHARLPDTEIVFIGLCPVPIRWDEREANRRLNELVRDYAKRTPNVKYIEGYDMTLDKDGNVREELFVRDRLHFNAEGYRLLAELVRPHLPRK